MMQHVAVRRRLLSIRMIHSDCFSGKKPLTPRVVLLVREFTIAAAECPNLWTWRLLTSRWSSPVAANQVSEVTRFSISPATSGRSSASKEATGPWLHLAHFGQVKTKPPSPT